MDSSKITRQGHRLDCTWRLGCAVVVLAVGALGPAAFAQCPDTWNACAGVSGGDNPVIFAMTMWDPDGAGPLPSAMVVGGEFSNANGVPANNIAMWNGTQWATFGTGMNSYVNALAVLPNGELIAGGNFTSANGVPVSYIARWTGSTWAGLGSGMNNQVNCLTVMQNGHLVAGGFFTTAGGVGANRIARWDGIAWWNLATGMNHIVYDVCVMPNGDLMACGWFTTAGGSLVNRLARWNGTAWSGMAGGANSNVLSLAVTPGGDLVVGGQFTFIGGIPANRIAQRNSVTGVWTPLGGGITGTVWELAFLPNGDLVAAGQFVTPTNYIARWSDDAAWHAMQTGMDAGVLALLVPPGGDLLAGGEFTSAGGIATSCLARWGPVLPALSQQPLSQSVCSTGSATFTVAATGTGPLAFTWQTELEAGVWTDLTDGDLLHNGILLGTVSGSHSPSMQIDSLTHFLDDRQILGLRCMVQDDCGDTGSASAMLVVWPVASGDANQDQFSDGQDVSTFVQAVVNGLPPGAGFCACNFTADNAVTLDDVPGFVDRILGS